MSHHAIGKLIVHAFNETSDLELEDNRTAIAVALDHADARRLAACWNACEGSKVEDLEELGADYIKPLIKLIDERDAMQRRADWLERMHTLHRTVEMLYVVDGYQVELCYDGEPISKPYHGETLAEAIDKAMAEFDADAPPCWVARDEKPDTVREQLAAAKAREAKLVAALQAAQVHVNIHGTDAEIVLVGDAINAAGAA